MPAISLETNPYFHSIACPVCASQALETYLKVPFSKLKKKHTFNVSPVGINDDTIINIDICKECGFVFVNPRIKPEYENVIYNECSENMSRKPELKFGTIENQIKNYKRRLLYLPVLLKLIHMSKNKPPLTIIDFGAGFGHSLSLATTLGLNAYGVELDKNRINYCRGLGLSVYSWPDFESKMSGLKTDLVIIQSVLEHIVDIPSFFSSVKRYCKLGTIIFINSLTPDLIEDEKRKNKYVKAHFVEHINYFTINSLDKLMGSYGFLPASKIPILIDNKKIFVSQKIIQAYRKYKSGKNFFERYYILGEK